MLVFLLCPSVVAQEKQKLPPFLEKITYLDSEWAKHREQFSTLLKELSSLSGLLRDKPEVLTGLLYRMLDRELEKQMTLYTADKRERDLLLFEKKLNKTGTLTLQVYERQNTEGAKGQNLKKIIQIKGEF